MPKPAVLSYPESVTRLKQGFDRLARLLAVTLGPTRGVVLSTTELKPQPEPLSGAAIIARRMVALPDPAENVGAMLLRHLVWRVHERVGDGAATTAVLAQAILEHAVRCVLTGANPVGVLGGIRMAAQAAIAALVRQACPPQGENDLVAVAQAVTGEERLSQILGEMFDLLGPGAYITIEDYVAPYLERVYLDGGRWRGRIVSPYLLTTPAAGRAVQHDCRVVLYAGNLSQVGEILPLLELAAKEPGPLLLVAQQISGEALNTLVATHTQSELKIAAVALTRVGEKARADLEDLSLLSGAQVISRELGRSLEHVTAADLGRARRVEASPEDLILAGGAGPAGAVRRQIEVLQRQLQSLPYHESEADRRSELSLRLGRLSGCAATLKIGALHKAERDYLHQRAEQGILALQAASEEGLLPGGGVAFLHCLPAVETLLAGTSPSSEERMGMQAVAKALEAPFRQILSHAGINAPGVALNDLRLPANSDLVYDTVHRRLAHAREAGVLDPAKVLRVALETAVSGAAMALSTDSVVLKRNPKVSYEP